MAVLVTNTDSAVNDLRSPGRLEVVRLGTSGNTIYSFVAANGLLYQKSIDQGATWAAGIDVLATNTGNQWFDLFYEKWLGPSGPNRDIVHCVAFHDAGSRGMYYNQLDISTDTLGTEVRAVPTSGGAPDSHFNAFGMSLSGNLYACAHGFIGTVSRRSSDDGVTWLSAANVMEIVDDYCVMYPDASSADPDDMLGLYWDESASQLSVKQYDWSANSFVETAIATITDTPTGGGRNWGSAFSYVDGVVYVASLDLDGTGSNTLSFWKVDGGTVTAMTSPVTSTSFMRCVSVDCDETGINVYYGIDKAAVSLDSLQIYRKRSVDGGATWGAEQLYSTRDSDIVVINAPSFTDGYHAPTYGEFAANDKYIEAPGFASGDPYQPFDTGAMPRQLWTVRKYPNFGFVVAPRFAPFPPPGEPIPDGASSIPARAPASLVRPPLNTGFVTSSRPAPIPPPIPPFAPPARRRLEIDTNPSDTIDLDPTV